MKIRVGDYVKIKHHENLRVWRVEHRVNSVYGSGFRLRRVTNNVPSAGVYPSRELVLATEGEVLLTMLGKTVGKD